MENFPKSAWFPGQWAPHASLLPLSSPSTSFPSLPHSEPGCSEKRHSLCDSRRERELEIAARRSRAQGWEVLHAVFRGSIRAWKSREPTACSVSWRLVGICSRCWESEEGRMGWEMPPAIQISPGDANNWVCGWPKCSSKRQITQEENQQKQNSGCRIPLALEANLCTGTADVPSGGFLRRPWVFFGRESFQANLKRSAWQIFLR